MFDSIMFSNGVQTISLGKNGPIKTIGVEFFTTKDELNISPINSRENVGRCHVSIPLEKTEIEKLINSLRSIVDTLDRQGE